MKNATIKAIQILLVLALMTIGFIFIGAFFEYKTLNGANIYAGLTFATVLCFVMSTVAYVTIKEIIF